MSDSRDIGQQNTGVPPVFITCRSLPGGETPYTVHEICGSAEKTSGYGSLIGAQRIGTLWRLYPKTVDQRVKLLLQGVTLRGHTVSPFDKNPFIVTTPEGEREAKTTKVVVGNIPISFSNDEIERCVVQLGCSPRSKLLMERDRDERGQLTRWLTGRRFIYVEIPSKPLPTKVQIGTCTASIYHREQKLSDETATCSRCYQTGHRAQTCENDIVCRSCRGTGHRSGDPACTLQAPAPPCPWNQSSTTPISISEPTTTTDLHAEDSGATFAQPRMISSSSSSSSSSSTVTTTSGQATPFPKRGRSLSQSTLDIRGRNRSASTKRQRSSPVSHPDGKVARTSAETPSSFQATDRSFPSDVTGNPATSRNEEKPA